MFALRVLFFSAVHFVLWYASAIAAYGTDLDHVHTRSALSNSAASVCSALQYPHDLILRALPTNWLQQAPAMAAAVILVASLLWGTVLALVWQLLFAKRRPNARSPSTRSGVA
jgi:hypothetical protein